MTGLRSYLGAALVALATPAVTAAAGGCGGSETTGTELSAEERDVTAAALLDQLSLEGALLDDSPSVRLLSATASASPGPLIAETRAAVPRPLDKLLRAWGAEVPRQCAAVRGALPDADGDGIPATASVNLGCSSAAYDVSGTAFVIDDNDGDPTSGFALGLADLRLRTQALGAPVTRTADASFLVSLRPDPSPGAVDMKLDVRVATTRTTSTGAIAAVSFASSGTTTYLPDADLTPITRSQHGRVTSTVHTTITHDGAVRTWTRRTPLSLHWNLACKAASAGVYGFDGGSVVYTDEQGNALRIDFTSCSTWTVSPQGQP